MAPHQNTRSRHQPLSAPLPPPTRQRAPVTGTPKGILKLPPELRMMVYKECNEDAKHSVLLVGCKPDKNGRARRTRLWLLSGHSLSLLTNFLCWEADPNYPYGIIQENERKVILQVDISSRNVHHTLRAIRDTLAAQGGLDNKISWLMMTGWTSISFRAIVHLIVDCGFIPAIGDLLGIYPGTIWSKCHEWNLECLLDNFYDDVFEYGRRPAGLDNVDYVARKVWKYLHPPANPPPVTAPLAQRVKWFTRRQFRDWMNGGFFTSQNWQEALQKS